LAPGDIFAGFVVVTWLDAQTCTVRRPGEAAASAILRFGEPLMLATLTATINALDADALLARAGHPLIPTILESGADAARGPYLVLSQPAGNWTPLGQASGLTAPAAAGLLLDLLLAAEHAAAAGHLLLLSPSQVAFDGEHAFIAQPTAPVLPLSAGLLADPAFLPPEVRAGEREVDGWAAGAFAAAAVVHATTGSALGYPREWHAVMAQLLSKAPEQRPRDVEAVRRALAPGAVRRFVSMHRTAFQTDIGRHHPINQDAGGVWSWQRWDGTPVTLAVVADGVSAGKHSEQASALTVELMRDAIAAHWRDRDFDADRADQLLLEAGYRAHQQVSAMPYDSFDEANATTLVAACAIGDVVTGIWCGDSRAYGVTPDGCVPLTRDHSWVNLVVDSGRMTLEQARLDPRAHVIARWLGASEPATANPGFDTFRRELAPGDRLLVCSDGLYMYFEPPAESDGHMERVIYGHGDDIAGAVGELVQTALDRGGFDNITAVLVAIE
jgi:protein phosphatase